MSTVEKALDILDLFSEDRPTIGLSEAARLLKRDKASVLRYLSALENKGFIEQDAISRAYCLGPAVVRLAVLREQTYPVNLAAHNVLKKLVLETGETAHLSHFAGDSLIQVAVEETSARGTRVFIDMSEPLSFHGTASGIAYLSQLPHARARDLLKPPLLAHTPTTSTDPEIVLERARAAGQAGIAESDGSFETEVYGIAAPVLGASGEACGAVAVATPASRMDAAARARIIPAVMQAARVISRHYGAKLSTREAAE